MPKIFISNRHGQKLAVVINQRANSHGLAFVMHGLGGFKEQPHIKTLAKTFYQSGYETITFDTANSFGESGGDYQHATIANYYSDLEDIIRWTKKQNFFHAPFILVGHSLGGFCICHYAEQHPSEILALLPFAPVVSGKLSVEAHRRFKPKEFKNWEQTGWLITPHRSLPGQIKRLPWSHMQERKKYDLLPRAGKITAPTLLIVGSRDDSVPPDHVEKLFRKIRGPKELHIIKDAPHTFRTKQDLRRLQTIAFHWLKKLSLEK